MPKTPDHWVQLKFSVDSLAASQLAKLKERTGVPTAKYLRGLIDRAMIVEGICPGPTREGDAGLKLGAKVVVASEPDPDEPTDGRAGADRPHEQGKRIAAAGRDAEEEQARIGVEVDRALLEALRARPEALGSLDDKTLAQLAVSRSPKPRDDDGEFRKGVASLREMLAGLPGVDDLTRRCEELTVDLAIARQRVSELECKAAHGPLPHMDVSKMGREEKQGD